MTLYEFWTNKDKLGLICDTLEKAKKFADETNRYCKRWFNERSLTYAFFWDTYKEYTVYTNKGTFLYTQSEFIGNYKLVKFEEIVFEDTKVDKPIKLPHPQVEPGDFDRGKINNPIEVKQPVQPVKKGVTKHKLF